VWFEHQIGAPVAYPEHYVMAVLIFDEQAGEKGRVRIRSLNT